MIIFPQISTIIQGTLLAFLPKKWVFPQNVPTYWALFGLFCPITQCVFTTEIPKKLNFPQITSIIQGTLLSFLREKVIFPQIAPAYRARFWFFCLVIRCVFTFKISKKFEYNTGNFIEFSSKKEFFFLNAPVFRALFWLFCIIIQCVFTPKKSQKVHFPSNCVYITGHFIVFLPKKRFFLKMRLHIEHYFDFFAQ